MNTLQQLLEQLESKIGLCELYNRNQSKGNVGWHIEHSLLTLNKVMDALMQSNPKEYKWRFNFVKIMVLTLKKIPKGSAKAPRSVVPKGTVDSAHLTAHLALTRTKINALEPVSKVAYFNHPYFGDLKRNQTLRFLEIHTQHHLAIIEDIINNPH